jgi:hypothetical protein
VQASRWKANRKKAEGNGSFAKCIEIWCAELLRGHVCQRCVILKHDPVDKKVGPVWAQREMNRWSEAGRRRISPRRMPLLGHVA